MSIIQIVDKIRKNLNVGKRRITTKVIKHVIKSYFKGKTNKSFNYRNQFIKFSVICNKSHRFKTNWISLIQGKWCPYCSHNKIKEKDVIIFIKNKGGKLNKNFKYKNSEKKFFITCEYGHKWKTNWNQIKQGHWCHICFGMVINKKIVQNLVKSKSGRLNKNWKYKGIFEKFTITCSKGHKFKSCVNYLRRDYWCPECRTPGICEQEFRGVIERYFRKKFPKHRPKWLRIGQHRVLELDGYNDNLKLAFEYQGKQHYDVGKYFKHNKKYLKNLKERDKIKSKLCKKNGVSLMIIPYWIPKNEWKSFIKNYMNTKYKRK